MQRANDDIAHLYQEFGGKPQSYRELTSTREAERARDRWPLISRVEDLSASAAVPPVRAGEEATAAPPRWLAGAPAAPAAPSPTQSAPKRVEPTLTPSHPAADAAAPLPWAHRVATQAPALDADAPAGTVLHTRGAVAAFPAPAPVEEPPSPPFWAPAAARAPAAGAGGMFASLRGQQSAPAAAPTAHACVPFDSPPVHASAAGQAPAAQPGPWAQQPASPRQTAHAAQPGLQGRSPLARLAQPAPTSAAPAGGLHNLFARLLGRGGS